MAEKKREVVRLHVDLVRTLLKPLAEVDRAEIMAELAIDASGELQRISKRLDEVVTDSTAEILRISKLYEEQLAQTHAWKKHNEQRIEEVYEARELLHATPNETLPMAVRRILFIPDVVDGEHK